MYHSFCNCGVPGGGQHGTQGVPRSTVLHARRKDSAWLGVSVKPLAGLRELSQVQCIQVLCFFANIFDNILLRIFYIINI